MHQAVEVTFVLQLALTLGPVAAYCVTLGLVNSQARPCLVGVRSDFLALTVALIPVVLSPMIVLIQNGLIWLTVLLVAGALGLFLAMMPGRAGGWVIYNIDLAGAQRLLERACRRLGWTLERRGMRYIIPAAGLELVLTDLAWLRNVTIRIERGQGGQQAVARRRLLAGLSEAARSEVFLPSPVGASLVVIGAMLMGVPMWYLFASAPAIIDVVRHILFA